MKNQMLFQDVEEQEQEDDEYHQQSSSQQRRDRRHFCDEDEEELQAEEADQVYDDFVGTPSIQARNQAAITGANEEPIDEVEEEQNHQN